MTRGRVWGYYQSDDGHTYALQTDADYAAMPERGWTYPAAVGTPIYPRQWKPRIVVGIDVDGRTRRAVVASAAADLWTGAVTTFTISGTDNADHTYTVIRSLGERMSARPT